MFIQLYTARIVLNTLGVEDYGIYMVVGGLVSMLTVMSASLTAASQRFITFELGKKKGQELNRVFSTTVIIHIGLAFLFLLVAETLGVWFLNAYLNIEPERMAAANWVFQGTMMFFVLNILSVPYKASIIAHERMKAFAYITILEAVLKLMAAFAIQILVFDQMASYGILVAISGAIVWFLFYFYSRRNFAECHFHYDINKYLLRKMTGFAGWNFIGASSNVIRKQGINVLLNLFNGVLLNAARGVSGQIEHAFMNFSNSFMTSIRPQIIKSYASGDMAYFMALVIKGARMSFYLLFILALPILFETEMVLKFWLKVVPDYAIIFVKLTLIYVLIESFSKTLITAMLATGRIKRYQIIVGGLQLLNFPLSYIFLRLGFEPYFVLIIAIFLSVGMLATRLILLKSMIDLAITYFIKKVIFNAMMITFLSLIIPIIIYSQADPGWLRFLFLTVMSLTASILIIYFVGCSQEERQMVKGWVIRLISSLK